MITSERADLYPSRVGGPASIAERKDPVIHAPDGTEAPLEPTALDAYDRDGFLFLPGFFDEEEVRSLLAAADALRAEPRMKDAEETVLEPDSGEVRSVFRFHAFDATLAAACRHPRLLAIVRHLLGDDVYLHQTRVNYKPGFRGKEFYWHSDFETWHVEDGMPRMRAVSASISLTQNTPHNGPLMVVPGSHRHFVTCPGHTPPNHYETSLRKQEYGVPGEEQLARLVDRGGIEAPTGPAGSVLFFECNTMHGSASNITPWPRTNLFVVYNALSNRLEEPFGGIPPRPDHIANRTDVQPLAPAAG